MKGRLVTEPGVHLIGMTKFNREAFNNWVADTSLSEVAAKPGTPLNLIAERVNRNEDCAPDVLPEFAGRFCYKSWEKGRDPAAYIENILNERHGSVFGHVHFSFAINGVSRSLTHELVRHGVGTDISQESQRFVDSSTCRFVVPPILLNLWQGIDCAEAEEWYGARLAEVEDYEKWQCYISACLEEQGVKGFKARKLANEAARASMPNAAETSMVWSVNTRALRFILQVRGSEHADMEIRRLANVLLEEVAAVTRHTFGDITVDPLEPKHHGVPSLSVEHEKV